MLGFWKFAYIFNVEALHKIMPNMSEGMRLNTKYDNVQYNEPKNAQTLSVSAHSICKSKLKTTQLSTVVETCTVYMCPLLQLEFMHVLQLLFTQTWVRIIGGRVCNS